MSLNADITFPAMGSEIRLVIGAPCEPGSPDPDQAAVESREWVRDFDSRLSRFNPASELCALNADPRTIVPASALLRAAVGAGLWAADRSHGLVDPTLLGELEAAGYASSRDDSTPAPLVQALAAGPPRRPAVPHPAARWRTIRVLDDRAAIERPPGVRFDTGGSGKGLAADALAHRLAGYERVAIDCGGDIRLSGSAAWEVPFDVVVVHPLTGTVVHRLPLRAGGVATSGLDVNVWRRPDGTYAHHLIDPATGEPAWTGVIGATAVAPTALEAETLAKAAILVGPDGARALLADHGGVIFLDDGTTEIVDTPAPARLRVGPRLREVA